MNPALVRATADVDTARAAYAAHAFDAFTGALRAVRDELVEPRVEDPARALRLTELLVEILAGFAMGSIARELLTLARRWFGDSVAAAIQQGVRRRWSPPSGIAVEPGRYLAGAGERPVAEALLGPLYARACASDGAVHTLVELVETIAIEGRGGRARAELAAALATLATDDALGVELLGEIRFGWSLLPVALAGRRFDAKIEERQPRSRVLWSSWQDKLLGARVAARTTATEAAGYIQLIS